LTTQVHPQLREIIPEIEEIEVFMPAYLLLLVAVLSRLLPHAGWMNFTAVGGALLYFGARRSWREMLAPLAVLMAADYYLTVYAYHYGFPLAGVPADLGVVCGGDGAGADSAAQPDHICACGRGYAAGADVVLPAVELCGLGGRRDVSAHAERTGHLLRCWAAVLSQ
jgi:hypothetical protein